MKPSRHRLLEACVAATFVALSTPPAWAAFCGTVGRPMSVTATAVAFGTYLQSSGTPKTANGTVTAACDNSKENLPSFSAALSTGIAGSYTPRRMGSGANRIDYNLYTSAAYTAVWGDGTGGGVTQGYSSGMKLSSVSYTTFGRIPASQSPSPGAYADAIMVTISY